MLIRLTRLMQPHVHDATRLGQLDAEDRFCGRELFRFRFFLSFLKVVFTIFFKASASAVHLGCLAFRAPAFFLFLLTEPYFCV